VTLDSDNDSRQGRATDDPAANTKLAPDVRIWSLARRRLPKSVFDYLDGEPVKAKRQIAASRDLHS